MSFYPQCGFLALGTHDYTLWRTKRSGFYPQCGFLALGTPFTSVMLSIHFKFLSAMRIFGFGNGHNVQV